MVRQAHHERCAREFLERNSSPEKQGARPTGPSRQNPNFEISQFEILLCFLLCYKGPMPKENTASTLRLDKWLWAARFFKSRSLAAEAAQGGKVHIAGHRVKPARDVRVGEELTIRRGAYEWVVTVKGLSARRGPAKEAALLYEESAVSVQNRAAARSQIQAEGLLFPRPGGRPTKKDRRDLSRLTSE